MVLWQRLGLAIATLFTAKSTASFLNTQQQPLAQQPLHVASSPWQLDFTSSAPHLFASAHALLQQWSNTMFPNGHSLAVVRVPAFTNLYHGRYDAELPPSPEWLAFDM